MVALVERARSTETKPVDPAYGTFGYTGGQIANLALDVVDRLRYSHDGAIEGTFEAICKLFSGARTPDEQKRIVESAKRLAENNMSVWQQSGPVVQQILIAEIGKLDSVVIDPIRPVIVEILEQVLKPDVSGTSNTYDSVTFHQGSVQTSETLRNIRRAAMVDLEKLFIRSKDDKERRAVVLALGNATRLPQHGNMTHELLKMVLDDALRVVRFHTSVAKDQSFELIQSIEHDLLWLYRRYRQLPTAFQEDPKIAKAQNDFIHAIFAFRDQVNSDRSFVIHKTLVGY